jgi:hypothetical protein
MSAPFFDPIDARVPRVRSGSPINAAAKGSYAQQNVKAAPCVGQRVKRHATGLKRITPGHWRYRIEQGDEDHRSGQHRVIKAGGRQNAGVSALP